VLYQAELHPGAGREVYLTPTRGSIDDRQPGGFGPENLMGVAPLTGPMFAVSLT
jgi:hypothetical protein